MVTDLLARFIVFIHNEAVVVSIPREEGGPKDSGRVTTTMVDPLTNLPPVFEGNWIDLMQIRILLRPDLACEDVEGSIKEPLPPGLRVVLERLHVVCGQIRVV